ncbi:hypothetical protein [Streptomyces sp. NPDC090135]
MAAPSRESNDWWHHDGTFRRPTAAAKRYPIGREREAYPDEAA